MYYTGNTPTGEKHTMINALHQRAATISAIALSACALAACDVNGMQINGQEGVPLSQIEMAGPAPSEVVLASGDTVIVSDGNTFDIKVEGADTDSLRFVRDGEVIGVTREKGWDGEPGATIRITMPPPKELVIAGSGTIKAQSLAATSNVSIGGAGTVEFGQVAADKLGINIGGSGTVRGAGTVKSLEVLIGGSGDVAMTGLKADMAEVSIGGSGDVAFASDGMVEANIGGAGDVTVTGNAKCTVNALGSGTLTCAPERSAPATALPAKPAE